MYKHILEIFKNNSFHARIFVLLLYFEKRFIIKTPFKVLRKIIIQGIYCSEVHPDSFTSLEALASVRLPHPYLIIIHRSARISSGCVIFHNVTVGVVENRNIARAAVIRLNVYIGCNSSILGDLEIEDNCKIGAHSLVLKSVPRGTTIVGLCK